MAEIKWSTEAKGWLEEIYYYIAEDNPYAAQKVVDDIYQKTQILKKFPEIGYLYQNKKNNQIRILLYGHYRIAYLLDSPKNSIVILGVFHGAIEIERYLKLPEKVDLDVL